MVENTKSAIFKTDQAHPVYLEKFARFIQDNGLKIEEFIRIKKPAELQRDIQNLSDQITTDLIPFKNKLSAIEQRGRRRTFNPTEMRPTPPTINLSKINLKYWPSEVMSDKVAFAVKTQAHIEEIEEGAKQTFRISIPLMLKKSSMKHCQILTGILEELSSHLCLKPSHRKSDFS